METESFSERCNWWHERMKHAFCTTLKDWRPSLWQTLLRDINGAQQLFLIVVKRREVSN